MNEDPSLRDLLLRRDLTPAEEHQLADWLKRHPEKRQAWLEDAALAWLLRRLPPAAVPSNFTARVLAEVERERRQPAPAPAPAGWRTWIAPRRWIPAAALVALFALPIGGWQWRSARQQSEYVRNVAALRALASMPPALLEDFDAIERFGQSSPPVDFELLAALQ